MNNAMIIIMYTHHIDLYYDIENTKFQVPMVLNQMQLKTLQIT